MKCNVGWWDRGLRIVIGLAILTKGVLAGAWWGLFGFIIFATGLLGKCLLYYPFSINTCNKNNDDEK